MSRLGSARPSRNPKLLLKDLEFISKTTLVVLDINSRSFNFNFGILDGLSDPGLAKPGLTDPGLDTLA